jgi:hypothetical protein
LLVRAAILDELSPGRRYALHLRQPVRRGQYSPSSAMSGRLIKRKTSHLCILARLQAGRSYRGLFGVKYRVKIFLVSAADESGGRS